MVRKTVLFIDDDEGITEVGKFMLEKSGYDVIAATNPLEALRHFALNPQSVDLVITDFEMPEMDGRELAAKLRDVRDDIPIVLSTGCHQFTFKTVRTWGIDQLLLKPYQPEELTCLVSRIFECCSSANL